MLSNQLIKLVENLKHMLKNSRKCWWWSWIQDIATKFLTSEAVGALGGNVSVNQLLAREKWRDI